MSGEHSSNSSSSGCGCGTIGCVIAIILSWEANHSILWAIIHGIFNWFYVIYYMIFK